MTRTAERITYFFIKQCHVVFVIKQISHGTLSIQPGKNNN